MRLRSIGVLPSARLRDARWPGAGEALKVVEIYRSRLGPIVIARAVEAIGTIVVHLGCHWQAATFNLKLRLSPHCQWHAGWHSLDPLVASLPVTSEHWHSTGAGTGLPLAVRHCGHGVPLAA